MKIKGLVSAGAAVALALGVAVSAQAGIVMITYQGVVSDGHDLTGLFGAAGADLTNAGFTAVFKVDDSVRTYVDIEPPNLFHLHGGTYYNNGRLSPVSGKLTINGHTVSVPGLVWGQVWRSTGGGASEISAEADDYQDNGVVTSSTNLYGRIFSRVNQITSDYDLYSPLSYTAQWGDDVGSVFQYTVCNDADSVCSADTYAHLDSASVTVTPVPEPATWTLLILGVGMIGFAARRRNEGAAFAA
jgi:hypothetical protein